MLNVLSHLRSAVAVSFLVGQATLVTPAQARDDLVLLSINDAMATPDAQAKLDGSVKFYFGSAHHPAIVRKFGDLVSNEKTNSLGKSTIKACEWAFLSALIKFQDRAKELGANAVVNIDSYYKREDTSSETQIQCHSGFFITGIALKGDFVKLAGS